MTASMYQGSGDFVKTGSKKAKPMGTLPKPLDPPMSDLQVMLENERRQHEQNYIYENGHNGQ